MSLCVAKWGDDPRRQHQEQKTGQQECQEWQGRDQGLKLKKRSNELEQRLVE